MRVDRAIVDLPLGGVAAPEPGLPGLVELDAADGEVTWSLAAGRDGDQLVLATSGPFGYAGGVQGTPEQLLGPDANWTVDRLQGGWLVWGPVVPGAERVTLTAADGTTRSVDVLDTGTDLPVGAFAVFVPEDEGLTAVVAEGGGEVLQRPVGLDRALADLAADPGLRGVGVLVERVG